MRRELHRSQTGAGVFDLCFLLLEIDANEDGEVENVHINGLALEVFQ